MSLKSMTGGQLGKGLFALGGTGAIILTVASVLMAVIGWLAAISWLAVIRLWPFLIIIDGFIWYLTLTTGLVLLLIGSIFVGIAYYAFYRHSERPVAIAGLVFGIICPVSFLVFAEIGMLPTGYGYLYPFYLSSVSWVLYWLGLLLFGTMLVIWGCCKYSYP